MEDWKIGWKNEKEAITPSIPSDILSHPSHQNEQGAIMIMIMIRAGIQDRRRRAANIVSYVQDVRNTDTEPALAYVSIWTESRQTHRCRGRNGV